MIIQIINLSDIEIFRRYSSRYKIFREVHSIDLLGLEVRDIEAKLADRVKKIILKEREICYKSTRDNDNVDLLVTASVTNFKELSRKILSIGDEDLGYRIVNVIKKFEEYEIKSYTIGKRKFIFDKSYVMGVLNITEDSFSDGGLYLKTEDAVNHALEMINDGADIIDIGGESSRPGSEAIPADKEADKVIPVIEKILKEKPDTIISIDTTKSSVANEALKCGAKIVNDISGFNFDPAIVNVVKQYDAAYVLMHMKGTPENMQEDPHYDDVVSEIYDFLFEKITVLKTAGISKIFVDPGIGFGKRPEDNFELLRRLTDFKSLGYPILVGVSRKSFIGKFLNLDVDKRDLPTSVIESVGIKNGARIIRTHNVKNGVQVCKLLNELS